MQKGSIWIKSRSFSRKPDASSDAIAMSDIERDLNSAGVGSRIDDASTDAVRTSHYIIFEQSKKRINAHKKAYEIGPGYPS